MSLECFGMLRIVWGGTCSGAVCWNALALPPYVTGVIRNRRAKARDDDRPRRREERGPPLLFQVACLGHLLILFRTSAGASEILRLGIDRSASIRGMGYRTHGVRRTGWPMPPLIDGAAHLFVVAAKGWWEYATGPIRRVNQSNFGRSGSDQFYRKAPWPFDAWPIGIGGARHARARERHARPSPSGLSHSVYVPRAP